MQPFLKLLIEMANSVDPGQSSLIWVCTVCICHFVRHYRVQNFMTLTVSIHFKGINRLSGKVTVKIILPLS